MRIDSIFRSAHWDPAVVLASIGANTLSLVVPISMIHLYDRIIPNAGFETLAVLGIVVVVAILWEAVLRNARRAILERAGEQFELRSYSCAFDVVVNGEPTVVDSFSRGRLMTGINSIERLRNMHTGDTALALLDLPFALLFLAAVSLISPVSGLVVSSILVSTLFVLTLSRKQSFRVQAKKRDLDARKTSFLGEVFSGIEAIKSLSIEEAMCRRYERLVGSSAETEAATAKISQFAQGFTATFAAFSPVLIACIGAFQVMNGQMTIGALAAVILLTGRIIQPALRVEAYLAGLSSVEVERRELEDILSTPKLQVGKHRLGGIERLDFKQVSTLPTAGKTFWFEKVDLSLARGDCVAIVGPSHQACSTFLRLFLGEEQLDGEYRINGQDYTDFTLGQRYRQVRYLTRGDPLLSGTLMENLSNFDASANHDGALELANKFGLDKALSTTKDGFNLLVGEKANGDLPSSMADVVTVIAGLVDSPDVVLFDNVNAAFDRETDQRFLELVEEGKSKRITLISTGRPSFQNLAERTFDVTPYLMTAELAEAPLGYR